MAKLSWTVGIKPAIGATTYYTDKVLSLTYMAGRTSYLDQFTGSNILITLNNQNNVAQYFTFGSVVTLNDDLYFIVTGVTFNDYPGNTGLSTCTVTAADYLKASGRTYGGIIATPQLMFSQIDTLYTGGGNTDIVRNGGTANAAYTIFTGLFLQFFQQGMTLESSGAVQLNTNKVYISGREQNNGTYFRTTFTRATSTGNDVSYEKIQRIRADERFANSITVNSDTLADITTNDPSSVALYGTYNDSVSARDASTTTETTSLATWLANTRSDPSMQSFEIEVVDTSQTSGALAQILNIWSDDTAQAKVHDLVYQTPGAASDTTQVVFLEGTRINVTPTQTRLTYYFSPMTLYQFFLLDNSTQGILDTSRLGF
jgi:hypothetical protein